MKKIFFFWLVALSCGIDAVLADDLTNAKINEPIIFTEDQGGKERWVHVGKGINKACKPHEFLSKIRAREKRIGGTKFKEVRDIACRDARD